MCKNRFDLLYNIYKEYDPKQEMDIELMVIGVGKNNSYSITDIINGKRSPWVKDESDNNVWNSWNVENRDLYFLDKESRYRYKINLTSEVDNDVITEKIDLLLNE